MGKKKIKTIKSDLAYETKQEEKLMAQISRKKKRTRKHINRGKAYIYSTYNNTIISLTDPNGNVLSQASAGRLGFKGAKKATPYAAGKVVKMAIEKAQLFGLEKVDVLLKGIGAGREAAVRALAANGLTILSIRDVTPIPHNGCRAKKPRRV